MPSWPEGLKPPKPSPHPWTATLGVHSGTQTGSVTESGAPSTLSSDPIFSRKGPLLEHQDWVLNHLLWDMWDQAETSGTKQHQVRSHLLWVNCLLYHGALDMCATRPRLTLLQNPARQGWDADWLPDLTDGCGWCYNLLRGTGLQALVTDIAPHQVPFSLLPLSSDCKLEG